jgi:hypothetical protein
MTLGMEGCLQSPPEAGKPVPPMCHADAAARAGRGKERRPRTDGDCWIDRCSGLKPRNTDQNDAIPFGFAQGRLSLRSE